MTSVVDNEQTMLIVFIVDEVGEVFIELRLSRLLRIKTFIINFEMIFVF
jgi:hypothetical protein